MTHDVRVWAGGSATTIDCHCQSWTLNEHFTLGWPAAIILKVKVKYLWGAFWQSRSLKWPDFPCPWSQALALCCWLRTLSVTYPLCGLALTSTTDTLSEMCSLRRTDSCLYIFVPSIIHNLTRVAYSPNGFHKLSWPGLKPATPRSESQHPNQAATPTCFNSRY